MLLPQELIRLKRDGLALSAAQIKAFVSGLLAVPEQGGWSEGQVAALAMAVLLRGMSRDETVALTRAMADSGERLHWDAAALGGPVVDKHSTGGVGDKVSLLLAPIVAACGAFVPMISGRGLGHTGGTLDKLAAIPGYDCAPDAPRLRRVVAQCGCAIVGQTAQLAPADRRLYAVRDISATVESLPLITASIVSKKLAAGLQHLVMDVKVGNGAFCTTRDEAEALARSIVEVAGGAGLPTRALLTDMNQVLGDSAGNALEVREAVDFLTGARREPRLAAVTEALCVQLLLAAGLAADAAQARVRIAHALDSGAAAERLARMVAALGGPADLLQRPAAHLAAAPLVRDVPAPHAGVVSAMDTRGIGLALIELGAGRRLASDTIDARVGIDRLRPLGSAVAAGEPLCRVHAASVAQADQAAARLAALVQVSQATTSAAIDAAGPVIALLA